jgi:hypothetical protein
VFRAVRVVYEAVEVQTASEVREPSGCPQAPIFKEYSAPDDSSVASVLECFKEGVEPTLLNLSIVVQKDEVFALDKLRATVASLIRVQGTINVSDSHVVP